jgi:hypothetical protein
VLAGGGFFPLKILGEGDPEERFRRRVARFGEPPEAGFGFGVEFNRHVLFPNPAYRAGWGIGYFAQASPSG